MDLFKITPADERSAIFQLVKESWVQNMILAEMLMPLYAKEKGITEEEAQKYFEEVYKKRHKELLNYIVAEFGHIDIQELI